MAYHGADNMSHQNGRFQTFAVGLLAAILLGGGGYVAYQASRVPALELILGEVARRLDRIESILDKMQRGREVALEHRSDR